MEDRAKFMTASTRAYHPEFDVLRIAASALVFVVHFGLNRAFQMTPLWMWTVVLSKICMDMFFVQSGYLIAHQWFRSYATTGRFSVAQFYLSRALRILPPYLLPLAALTALSRLYPSLAVRAPWRFLTFTMNFFQRQ